MTVRTTPSSLQALTTHAAENDRLMAAALLSSPMTSFAGGVGALDPGHGVAISTDLAVTANGTPNMSVNVAAGSAFIRGTQSALQGVYHAINDATVNLSISAADPTNARRDLIILQVRDAAYGGADNDARLVVVTGTPAASPADPSLAAYPNALVLARVTVAAADTSITSGEITDLRTRVIGRGGVLGYAEVTTDQTGIGTSETDLTGLTITVSVPAGRRIKITGYARLRNGEASSNGALLYIDEGGTNLNFATAALNGTGSSGVSATVIAQAIVTPSTGSHTYKLQASFVAGSSNLMDIGATQPAFILVEDLGPI
jgi:hypothetical protein